MFRTAVILTPGACGPGVRGAVRGPDPGDPGDPRDPGDPGDPRDPRMGSFLRMLVDFYSTS